MVAFLVVAVCLLVGTRAQADPIGLGSLHVDSTVTAATTQTVAEFVLHLETSANRALFEDIPLTASSVGQTFLATSASDPDFNEFATRFANGQPNFVGYLFGFFPGAAGGVDAASEAALFTIPAGTVDFAGNVITAFALTIRDLTIGPSTLGPGLETGHLVADLNVLGDPAGGPAPTPEPATLLLLGSGLAAAARWRRRWPPLS